MQPALLLISGDIFSFLSGEAVWKILKEFEREDSQVQDITAVLLLLISQVLGLILSSYLNGSPGILGRFYFSNLCVCV